MQTAFMEVVVPPQISDKMSTQDVSVAEGGSAKFICAANGHPMPSITWRKQPKTARSAQGKPEIARIRTGISG